MTPSRGSPVPTLQFLRVHYKRAAAFFNARFENYQIISSSASARSKSRQTSFSLTRRIMFVESSNVRHPTRTFSANAALLRLQTCAVINSNLVFMRTYSALQNNFCVWLMLFLAQPQASRSKSQRAVMRYETELCLAK